MPATFLAARVGGDLVGGCPSAMSSTTSWPSSAATSATRYDRSSGAAATPPRSSAKRWSSRAAKASSGSCHVRRRQLRLTARDRAMRRSPGRRTTHRQRQADEALLGVGDAGQADRAGAGAGLAAASPSTVRSTIRSCSNSAIAASMWKNNRPPGVVVSIPWDRTRSPTCRDCSSPTSALRLPTDRPAEPVQLGDHQGVPGPQVQIADTFGVSRPTIYRHLAEPATATRARELEASRAVGRPQAGRAVVAGACGAQAAAAT